MPSMAPTTLLVTGSISMTLSPAALVWTIRTVAASSASGRAIARATPNILVFIARHFKLAGHVVDGHFLGARPVAFASRFGVPGPCIDARLRVLQGDGAAALHREAAGSRALPDVPFHRHRVPPPGAAAGPLRLQRSGGAEALPDGEPLPGARSSCH